MSAFREANVFVGFSFPVRGLNVRAAMPAQKLKKKIFCSVLTYFHVPFFETVKQAARCGPNDDATLCVKNNASFYRCAGRFRPGLRSNRLHGCSIAPRTISVS